MRQRRQRLVLTKRSSAAAKSTARPSYLVGVFHDISREKNLLRANQQLLRKWPVATKATEFSEIRQSNGHYAVQGH